MSVLRRYGWWCGVPAVVAGVAAWAALADDKNGWTVVAAALAGAVGAFGPTVADRIASKRESRRVRADSVKAVRVADLPKSVTWLLRPDQQVVPFFGRGWLLQQLETWAADPDAVAVRLLTGAGGVGKTRLAREFTSRLAGWRCEWIHPEAESETAELITTGTLGPRSLLILDYAEARDRTAVAELLCSAQQAPGVRLLLLARTAGLWWESLSAAFPEQPHLIDAMTSAPDAVIEVTARVDEAHEPHTIVAEAAASFGKHLGRQAPLVGAGSNWPVDTPVLRLHAVALVAVLDGTHRQGAYDVLGELLGHESRYWRSAARRSGLVSADDDPAKDAVLQQLAGIAALVGADNPDEVSGIVRRTPLAVGADPMRLQRYASWLSDLYPAEGGAGLGVMQPDLLAETLAIRVVTSCSEQERIRVFTGLSREQAVRVLTVLGRARVHQPDADAVIDAALAADIPRMMEAVVAAGVQFPGVFTPRAVRLLERAKIDPEWARDVAKRVPYPSLELAKLASALTTHIVDGFTVDTSVVDRARWISEHALRLGGVGRRAEALAANQEVVDLRRELVGLNRAAHLPSLARAVLNLAGRLAETGQRTEALAASLEAVDLHRELVALNRDAYLPNLATSVNNHAGRLAQAGQRAGALAASQEAVDLRRELVSLNRDAHLPDLATSLANHGVELAKAGWQTEALVTSQEAVDLHRELVTLNRDAYLPNLAASVNNHANRLAEAGRGTEALATSLEAVSLRRELFRLNRDAYQPALATSLWNVGFVALKTDSVTTDEVVELTAEGVSLFEILAAETPAAFAEQHRAAARTLARVRERENTNDRPSDRLA